MSDASAILERLAHAGARPRSLTADSRAVRPGDLFIAYPGTTTDGRRYIRQAIDAGAAAVLWERTGYEWDRTVALPNLPVEGLRELAGPIAAQLLGDPSAQLWVIGITGTNGKTTTSQWIAQALAAGGRKPLVIGTLGIGMAGTRLASNPNTTPDAIVLQRALAEALAAGADSVSLEVSSIGLAERRVDGMHFDCAVFTNLTRDHLDYHGDMERYARAKLELFAWPGLSAVIVNLDDSFAGRILATVDPAVRRIGYTITDTPAPRPIDAILSAHDLQLGPNRMRFRVQMGEDDARVEAALVGRYNVSNLLAVIGALVASGVPFPEAARVVGGLVPAPGRMQRLGGSGKPTVLIDYAHTPDALEKVLEAARELATASGGRLVAVFGCGGDRDRGKRPVMGEIAARVADRVVLTSDNPRSEPARAIIDDILAGIPGDRARPTLCVDRAIAIRDAIRSADPADVIVLAGKGHEPYQEIAGRRYPFSDLDQARGALGEGGPC